MTTFVGVDPGLTGAAAFIRDEQVLAIVDLPTRALAAGETVTKRIDGGRLFDSFANIVGQDDCVVFVELVRVLPPGRDIGGKERKGSAQSQSSLVRSLGAIEAVCDVFGAPAALVTPQQWQAHFGLVSKDRELREPGALPEAVRTALRLYPGADRLLSLVKHHNRAEALLIAHFASTRPPA